MLNLSERQQATVAAAVTVVASLVILCTIGALVWLLGVFLARFSNVFVPLAVSAIVALVLRPYYHWLLLRRMPAVVALGVVFLSILLPVVGMVWFFGDLLVGQVLELIKKVPAWREEISQEVSSRWPQIRELWDSYGMTERLETTLEEYGGTLLSGLQFVGLKALTAGASIFSAVGALFNWALVPIYVAFILLGGGRLRGSDWASTVLPFFKPETRDDVTYLVEEFVEIVVAFFRGQLLIAFLQGVLYALGFWIIDLRFSIILGLSLGFLNIIPYLGSIVGLGAALPLALFQEGGGWWMVGAVLIVFTIVQMIEGYILTPRIMGNQTGLHPMAIMVAIFFWGSALSGILGMLLAIPLTAFFVVFWRLARENYIKEVV